MITWRLVGHGTPKPWHTTTTEFAARVAAYCLKSKADIWVQYR